MAAPELGSSVEKAIRLVEDYPRTGRVAEGIYIGRQFVSHGEGKLVNLIAVWKGAERLSGDSTVRCITLERNPNLWGIEDAVVLRIEQESSNRLQTFRTVYRNGVIAGDKPEVAHAVLNNIVKELV